MTTASKPTKALSEWPLWEIFVRSKQGLEHKHCGSLHASDAQHALQMARDVYTRPEVLGWKGKKYRVPKILLTGHHANIDSWKGKKS